MVTSRLNHQLRGASQNPLYLTNLPVQLHDRLNPLPLSRTRSPPLVSPVPVNRDKNHVKRVGA